MTYFVKCRENDFDLVLYDANRTVVFYASRVQYSQVSSTFDEAISRHYLDFMTMNGFFKVMIDLSVQDHLDLLQSLRVIND